MDAGQNLKKKSMSVRVASWAPTETWSKILPGELYGFNTGCPAPNFHPFSKILSRMDDVGKLICTPGSIAANGQFNILFDCPVPAE